MSPARIRELAPGLGLAALFYAAYQVSLTTTGEPLLQRWFWGSDSSEPMLGRQWLTWGAKKHPLVFIIYRVLFAIGRRIYGLFLPDPLMRQMGLVFPVAVCGAATVFLLYAIMLRLGSRRSLALAVAALYGGATGIWMFSSYPDTYVVTGFITLLFFWALLRWKGGVQGMGLVVLTHAMACYAAPQQILLGVIPALHMLRTHHPRKTALRPLALYAAGMAAIFVIPYRVFLELSEGWKAMPIPYLEEWGSLGNLLDPLMYLIVAANGGVFTAAGLPAHPYAYTYWHVFAPWKYDVLWWLAALGWLGLLVITFVRAHRSSAGFGRYVPDIQVFAVVYIGFFVFFNPREAFIYMVPLLVPIVLVMHAGLAGVRRPVISAIWILAFLLAANTVRNLLYVRTIRPGAQDRPTTAWLPQHSVHMGDGATTHSGGRHEYDEART